MRELPKSIGNTRDGGVPHPVADWVEFVALMDSSPDVVRFSVADEEWVFIADPFLFSAVLKRPFDEFGIGPLVEALTGAGASGNSLVANYDFPSWRSRRSIVQPTVSPSHIRSFADVMVRRSTDMVQSWKPGALIDVEKELAELSLDILVECLFSDEVSEARSLILDFEYSRQADIIAAAVNPGADVRRSETNDEKLRRLDQFIYDMIQRRRDREPNDLLGMLVHGRDEDGQLADDRTIRSEAVSLFFAGYSTIALALTFSLVLLASNRHYFEKLGDTVAKELDRSGEWLDALGRLPMARQIVEESLRLYPVSDLLDRRALVDTEVGGYMIPKDTALITSAWLPHRSDKYFPNPLSFDPDRFAPDRRRSIPNAAYFPFGDGRHVCVGKHFALMEASIALVAIAQRLDFRLASKPTPALTHDSVLRPKEPVIIEII